MIDNYAPAAVLINRKFDCLYSLGRIDRYLRVAPGHPTEDLLAMVRPNIRTKLRSTIQQAGHKKLHIVVAGGEISVTAMRSRSILRFSRFYSMATTCS